MQPLLDLILGRRSLTSNASDRRQYQKHSSERSGHLQSSDIEMSRRRNIKKAKQFEENLTLTTRQEKEGSQESILASQSTTHPLPRQLSGGIIKTNEVTVAYDVERDADQEYPTQWKGV